MNSKTDEMKLKQTIMEHVVKEMSVRGELVP
jgi:hypothetical protein